MNRLSNFGFSFDFVVDGIWFHLTYKFLFLLL